MDQPISWLLAADPWVRYRTILDLMGRGEDDPEVVAARADMLMHPKIRGLVAELAAWPGRILNSHKSADHPIHKLTFLADLGLRMGDPGLDFVIERIMAHQAPAGPFQVLMNIPVHFGGTGEDQWAWALCDAPLLLYALARFGLGDDPGVKAAAAHLSGLVRENGWPCAGDLGKFRGPGRKDDPCPYANLAMLKALSALPVRRDGPEARIGAETQLRLWETRREQHPYMFFMGTDFCKLKAPLVWYDILHVLDVLTRFAWILKDTRLLEMAAIVKVKTDVQGRFTPESVWKSWGDWEFGQKKSPSPWLTFLVQRVLRRMLI
ncbi:MAG: hypothetical protein ACM3ZC_01920 [Bacteroidota bacterium]